MIAAGQTILHYRLTEKLGEGGMGVVWKADDTTLDRPVAIKVLPPHFAADPERLARFEREARLLASLNHPGIATVFSVHVVDGVRYLTMEYVPGEDLAQRIARGPIPVTEAIEIARQIAQSLEAAHEHGVVHRDLKPANVRLTPDGRVKVLDFGLAKALEGGAGTSAVLSQSPTFAGTMAPGVIVGTAAYMSPEQARGQNVDRRTDIWAFGTVLFEMLSGQRAFPGETVSDTLAGVLRAEPERALLPQEVPAALRTLLDRCLTKDARRRLRDIGEALVLLEDVQAGRAEEPVSSPSTTPAPRPRRLLLAAGVPAIALVAGLGGWLLKPAPDAPVRKLALALNQGGAEILAPSLAPDGRQLAYLEQRRLVVRAMGEISPRVLAEDADEDFRPAWSPDSRFLAFATSKGISRADLTSGAVAPVCRASEFTGGSGGFWTNDGRIVFTRGLDHVYVVSAGGGEPSILIHKDSLEADLHHPVVLPGNRGVLVVRHMVEGGPNTLSIIREGKRHDLLKLTAGFLWDPVWDPRGYIVYARIGEGSGIWALPFSLERMKTRGEPFLVMGDAGAPSIAADGSLAYRQGSLGTEARVVRLETSGALLDTLTDSQYGNFSLALSPDERMLIVETRSGGEGDLWLHDLERRGRTRFAHAYGRQSSPGWSPDGKLIYFNDGADRLWVKPADGSQPPRLLLHGFQPQVTADGRHLIYCKSVESGVDLWYSNIAQEDSLPLLQSPSIEALPMPSPQGGYLLYVSNETGQNEVYLREFPSGSGRWQVSTQGGSKGLWSRKGDRILYWSGEHVYEVPIELRPTVRMGAPRKLLDLRALRIQTWGRYTVLPTSKPDEFLAVQTTGNQDAKTHVVLVENWLFEFASQPRGQLSAR